MWTALASVLIGIATAGMNMLAGRDWQRRVHLEEDKRKIDESALARIDRLNAAIERLRYAAGYHGGNANGRKPPDRSEPG